MVLWYVRCPDVANGKSPPGRLEHRRQPGLILPDRRRAGAAGQPTGAGEQVSCCTRETAWLVCCRMACDGASRSDARACAKFRCSWLFPNLPRDVTLWGFRASGFWALPGVRVRFWVLRGLGLESRGPVSTGAARFLDSLVAQWHLFPFFWYAEKVINPKKGYPVMIWLLGYQGPGP